MVRCIVNSASFGYKEQGAKPIDNRRATSDDVGKWGSIDYIDEDIILQIIRDKNLLSKKQVLDLKTIIEEAIIDNEIMIDILYENKILPLISNIFILKSVIILIYKLMYCMVILYMRMIKVIK